MKSLKDYNNCFCCSLFLQQHVQDGRKESLDGFVKTFSKPLPVDGNAGVYALDCEMVRITVIELHPHLFKLEIKSLMKETGCGCG